MLFMFYLEKKKIVVYNMLVKLVKTRYSEHYSQMIKPRKINNFLYRQFKKLINLLVVFLICLLKKNYDGNSS